MLFSFLFRAILLGASVLALLPTAARGADLGHTIQAGKPSVVGIGTLLRTRTPPIVFVATGFVTGDGLSVITNAHGIPELDAERKESIGIVIARGDSIEFRPARVVAMDREHDLAHLRIEGAALPALTLGDPGSIGEGQSLAFTGFPLGMALGLRPVTHRAMLAAITPIVLPSINSRKLDVRAIGQLGRSPFPVFQLDATAYPGNSGSPVYDPDTGVVYAVINMVFVKGMKETAISSPSGITYAIPASHARALLQQKAP